MCIVPVPVPVPVCPFPYLRTCVLVCLYPCLYPCLYTCASFKSEKKTHKMDAHDVALLVEFLEGLTCDALADFVVRHLVGDQWVVHAKHILYLGLDGSAFGALVAECARICSASSASTSPSMQAALCRTLCTDLEFQKMVPWSAGKLLDALLHAADNQRAAKQRGGSGAGGAGGAVGAGAPFAAATSSALAICAKDCSAGSATAWSAGSASTTAGSTTTPAGFTESATTTIIKPKPTAAEAKKKRQQLIGVVTKFQKENEDQIVVYPSLLTDNP